MKPRGKATRRTSRCRRAQRSRRAAIAVWSAILMVVVVGMVAFGVDVGYMMLTRTQLQAAADSAALAAAANMSEDIEVAIAEAQKYAGYHWAGGAPVQLAASDVEFGLWDANTRTFTPTPEPGNAVRVTARRTGAALFFAPVLGHRAFNAEASAVAMANPRDICFVVDLSGSMNDDTEPCWATTVVNNKFAAEGFPTIGNELMEKVYEDFGFGSFPGKFEYIGEPLGVAKDKWAYAEMTKDNGPLTSNKWSSWYRISDKDSELTRKEKAYRWIIDYQLARIMPNAKPVPNSKTNYDYWEKYLDYVIYRVSIRTSTGGGGSKGGGGGGGGGSSGGGGGGGSSGPKPPKLGLIAPKNSSHELFAALSPRLPFDLMAGEPVRQEDYLVMAGPSMASGLVLAEVLTAGSSKTQPGTPPYNRGSLPPKQDSDRIDKFNNPNIYTFPETKKSPYNNLAKNWRNYVGYITYVQFMMDFGRDYQPLANTYTPLSTGSPYCPYHWESTAGGTFKFPPREQPMHAARRALIAALQVVKERNASIPDPNQRDWVSLITFDRLGPGKSNVPIIVQPLTGDYDEAMNACTQLQASGDNGASTATEAGLILAYDHLSPAQKGNGGVGNVGAGSGAINGGVSQGRKYTNKVVVLLTDGVPNLYQSPEALIDSFMSSNPNADFYGGGYYWLDAPIMQAMKMYGEGWQLFPVGVGLGTDYDFMDRLARSGGTADENGQSARGSGNPANYEQRLTDIFTEIITTPRVRLVD